MNKFEITIDEKKTLLKICRLALNELFNLSNSSPINSELITPTLQKPCGAFVTLYKKGKLRGCIGRFATDKPLIETIKELVRSSALNDSRFKPVEPKEISELNIEISILTPLERISSIDEIILGKHGIYIKKGSYTGTFLPQVASKTNWKKEEFVCHCSRDKAGIGWYGWKDAELFRYEAIIIKEDNIKIN